MSINQCEKIYKLNTIPISINTSNKQKKSSIRVQKRIKPIQELLHCSSINPSIYLDLKLIWPCTASAGGIDQIPLELLSEAGHPV
jgi:arginine exporter protein ArgO